MLSSEQQSVLICPKCQHNSLVFNHEAIHCQHCQQHYPITQHIPLLFYPEEPQTSGQAVTEVVKAFYEETPFPNYDDLENVGDLIQKARTSVFLKMLDEQLPFGIKLLECGCGTGQWSIFLSVANRSVFGVDMCLNSLKLAQNFKETHGLKRVHFLQMNLFRPIFKPESFHVVFSNGVLHHTHNPKLAFTSIARLVKPGGYIIIGLYHRYGRLWTDIRRAIFNITGNRFKYLDSRVIDKRINETKRYTWFMDQYKNPHESKHTINEVLHWLTSAGFSFVNSIPRVVLGREFTLTEKLFTPQPPGHAFERFLVESSMLLTNSKEGGFFIVIGKKINKTKQWIDVGLKKTGRGKESKRIYAISGTEIDHINAILFRRNIATLNKL